MLMFSRCNARWRWALNIKKAEPGGNVIAPSLSFYPRVAGVGNPVLIFLISTNFKLPRQNHDRQHHSGAKWKAIRNSRYFLARGVMAIRLMRLLTLDQMLENTFSIFVQNFPSFGTNLRLPSIFFHFSNFLNPNLWLFLKNVEEIRKKFTTIITVNKKIILF